MSIGDVVRQAVDAVDARWPVGDVEDEAAALLDRYRQRAADPRERLFMELQAADAELGVAAYLLGVHLQVHDHPDALRWLRLAAERDVADAAARLALLYELRSVVEANCGRGEGGADLDAARRWAAVAASAGYPGQGDRLDDPAAPVCCARVESAAAVREAEQIRVEAARERDRMARQARADVQLVVDAARAEVGELARRYAELEVRLLQLRQVVYDLAAITPARPRGLAWSRRHRAARRVAAARSSDDFWESLLDEVRERAVTAGCEHLLRPLVARIMMMVDEPSTSAGSRSGPERQRGSARGNRRKRVVLRPRTG
ncbi:hypothetical protein [Micromonospora sp. LOL_023]|uniref:hypothetical protein n=1 Tax=Micromonospora sp. LOL_023 TaxID=3345418 RepID=UPI003A861CAF